MTARWVRIALEWCAPVWLVWIAALVWVSCSTVESIEPSGDTGACERESPSGECGVVYGFARGSSNELGHFELCVHQGDIELAQAMFGLARPSWSDRFTTYTKGLVDPPCFWICPTARGCNAYDGCFCP